MNVITVIPITKQRGINELSYYTDQIFCIGDIIKVKVRNQTYESIITQINSIEYAKPNLKNNSYSLKPLNAQKPLGNIGTKVTNEIIKLSKNYLGNQSVVANQILSKSFFRHNIKTSSASKESIWQCSYNEFKQLIKTEIKTHKDYKIAVVVADKNQLLFYSELLKEFKPLKLTGQSSDSSINKITESELIITTQSLGGQIALSIDHIVIVDAGTDAWRDRRWPYLRFDDITAQITKAANKNLTTYSQVLDPEAFLQYTSSQLKQNNVIDFDHSSNIKNLLIERRTQSKKISEIVFDKKVLPLLQNESKKILYVTRRGLYPVLACIDCGETTYKQEFLSDIKQVSQTKLINNRLPAELAHDITERCNNCGSWRLSPIAITLGQTQIALEELELKSPIYIIDTISQTWAQSRAIVKQFETSSNGILLTTQRGIFHLKKKVDDVLVVSVDAGLSTNSLNIETSLYRLLLHLQFLATRNYVIQTRLPKNDVLQSLLSSNSKTWHRNTSELLMQLQFPPYTIQLKVTLPDTQSDYDNFTNILKLLPEGVIVDKNKHKIQNRIIIILTFNKSWWSSDDSTRSKLLLSNLSNSYQAILNPDLLL